MRVFRKFHRRLRDFNMNCHLPFIAIDKTRILYSIRLQFTDPPITEPKRSLSSKVKILNNYFSNSEKRELLQSLPTLFPSSSQLRENL